MKKFLFDTNNFDKARREGADAVYSEEQINLARTQARADGKAEGVKETRQQQEELTAKSLDRIALLMEKLAAAEEKRDIERMTDATKLAMRVAHKLLPQFAQKFALQEIERVILSAIEARKDEPRVAVMVSAAQLDPLKSRVDALALEKGYAGKLILIADDNLGPSDVRVEWADGGAERLYERLFAQVESEFAKAIAGMNATMEKLKD